MKQVLFFFASLLCTLFVACSGTEVTSSLSNHRSPQVAGFASNSDHQVVTGGTKTYQLTDPTMNNLSMSSWEIPVDWKGTHRVDLQWSGSVPVPAVYLKFSSADEKQSFEIFPTYRYVYLEGETTNALRSYGQEMPNNIAPMSPSEYLQRVIVPEIRKNGGKMEVASMHNIPSPAAQSQSFRQTIAEALGTVNGMKMKLLLTINQNIMAYGGNRQTNWDVTIASVVSTTDLQDAVAIAEQIFKSASPNPEWQREYAQLVNKGIGDNRSIAVTRFQNSQQNNADLQRTYDGMNQNFSNKFNQPTSPGFGDYIRGEGTYLDPNTGERVKLDYGKAYQYKDNYGQYHGTDTRIDQPANYNLTEMEEHN
jgi:hypothetical protein